MEEWNEAHVNMKAGILRETGRTHKQYLRAQKRHEHKRFQKAEQYKGFHGNLDGLDESETRHLWSSTCSIPFR